jgi:hypothetical protein
MAFKKLIGSKREVYGGTARKTPGGLGKAELMMNSRGRIVSKKQSAAGLRTNNLGRHIELAMKSKGKTFKLRKSLKKNI